MNTFNPRSIRISPPATSAHEPTASPKRFPIRTPAKQTPNVTNAIIPTEISISDYIAAKLTPAASASILVATA